MAAALMPVLAVGPNDDQIVALSTPGELPPRRIALAVAPHRALSPAARTFIECAIDLCASLRRAGRQTPGGVGTIAPR